MKERIRKIKQIANGLQEIPANEQSIGHFQVAVQDALLEVAQVLLEIERELHPK
jgi:3-dehydroquinate dehydratase